ncbi:MAG: four-carbon acid sugar kinase family protein [Ramlibacter sp.]
MQTDSRAAHPQTVVIADDLSGAGECASEFTLRGGSTCLQLVPGPATGLSLPGPGVLVWDLDTRDTAPVLHPAVTASIGASRRIYLKIDSLLRGNWPLLVAAVVRAAQHPALMCPALPRLQRGLHEGRIDIPPGHRLTHYTASAVEGLRQAGLQAGHHRLDTTDEGAMREGLRAALARDAVTVVDARTDAELDAMARVLESLPTPYTAIGSAGLAGALARQRGIPAAACTLGAPDRMAVLVGSLTGPARQQLSQLAQASGEAVRWWHPGQGLQAGGEAGHKPAPRLRLYATRCEGQPAPAGRELARHFARDVAPHLEDADCIVATGGETARALCDVLGMEHLQVLGQLEPGISLARLPGPRRPRYLAIKSGSFGDPDTLVRLARSGGLLPAIP